MTTLLLAGLFSALASSLTFMTGFGLGTILLPAFVVVMGPALAVAAVAPVHLFHNFGKLFLLRSHVDRRVLVQFGGPALVAAAVGAWGLSRLTDLPELAAFPWTVWGAVDAEVIAVADAPLGGALRVELRPLPAPGGPPLQHGQPLEVEVDAGETTALALILRAAAQLGPAPAPAP